MPYPTVHIDAGQRLDVVSPILLTRDRAEVLREKDTAVLINMGNSSIFQLFKSDGKWATKILFANALTEREYLFHWIIIRSKQVVEHFLLLNPYYGFEGSVGVENSPSAEPR